VGPIALFDKSFLQSLSIDESVWFDHFFLPVITPLFFVETLADLTKKRREGSSRTPEDEVRVIAYKTPVLSGVPCVHHSQLCIANLMGYPSPHLGQVPLAGGRPVRSADGKAGVVFEKSREAEAFSRWQHGQFRAVERDIASSWRKMLSELNLPEVARGMRALGITAQTCKSVEEAYRIATTLVHSREKLEQQLALLFAFVRIPNHLWTPIVQRWIRSGSPPLAEYANYAAHVLKVELFFQIALAANIISADRPSNRVDIAYLFYLPFCHIFVSGDKLHRRCAQSFLNQGQNFVWANDLKNDLARINHAFMAVPNERREEGLFKMAPYPPGDSSNLVVSLWKKHAPNARQKPEHSSTTSPEAEQKLMEHLNSFAHAPSDPEVAELPPDRIENITIERLIPPKRGNWWLIPKRVADAHDDSPHDA